MIERLRSVCNGAHLLLVRKDGGDVTDVTLLASGEIERLMNLDGGDFS
jgi:hypothetical protein